MATDKQVHAAIGELGRAERLVAAGDAVFTSPQRVGRGYVVLTDQRLICVDRGLHDGRLVELPLSMITAAESGIGHGRGSAKRGDLTISSAGATTHLTRIRPWECAGTIASYVRQRLTQNH